MKISKSKQELARIISENGGWRNGEFAAQDGDGSVGGYDVKPKWNSLTKYWWRESWGEWFLVNKIKNHHQTVLSRDEYFHLYPAPDADGWIEWTGGECPCPGASGVARRRDGKEIDFSEGEACCWSHGKSCMPRLQIVAYRIRKPAEPTVAAPDAMRPEDFGAVDDCGLHHGSKPTIEQLSADYRNAKDLAERKQQEADAAKADADEKLRVLEIAGEALGLLVSPITEKQEPGT